MTRARTISRRLRSYIRSEEGIALPTAMFATIAAMALGSVAVISSIDVQHGTARDNGSKSAIAAADAGANVALARQNRYATELSEEDPCVNLNSEEKLEPGPEMAGNPGWCAPIPGEVGGAAYSYRVSAVGVDPAEGACGEEYEVCIVSTGSSNDVDRRVELSLEESSFVDFEQKEKIQKTLEEAEEKGTLSQQQIEQLEQELEEETAQSVGGGGVPGLFGKDEIAVSGNGDIRVGVGTNGDLVTSGNASICGDIQVGIGKSWTKSGNASQCSGYEFGEGTTTLPDVSSFIPSDIATNNSNGRITRCSNGLPAECQQDTYSGGKWSSSQPFDPSNRRISLAGNTTLTVGGGDYWICSLSLSGNSKLIMASGAHVRFFFDTPENCGISEQISLSGNNEITATGYKPGQGQFDMPGFYLLGSTSSVSQVDLSGNYSTTDEFVIYGPNSYINISGNATFKGIVAGKRIAMSGNGTIEQDAGFEAPPEIEPGGGGTNVEEIEGELEQLESEGGVTQQEIIDLKKQLEELTSGQAFHAGNYVECTGVASGGQAPNSGC
jgi:hypothetical protein